MTKTEASTRKSARATRSSAKRTTVSKASGRSVLGDVSINRVTRSSKGKVGQKIQSEQGVQVRRSTRKSGEKQQQQNDTKAAKAEAVAKSGASKRRANPQRQSATKPVQFVTVPKASGGKNNGGGRKRKLDDDDNSEQTTTDLAAVEAVARGRKRARMENDGLKTANDQNESVGTRARSTQRSSRQTAKPAAKPKATTKPAAKSRPKHSKPQQEDEDLDNSASKAARRSSRKVKTAAIKSQSKASKPEELGTSEATVPRRSSRGTTAGVAEKSREGSDNAVVKGSHRTRKERNTDTKSPSSRTRSQASSQPRTETLEDSTPPKSLCADFLDHTDYGLKRDDVLFDSSKYTFGMAEHDESRRDDVLEVSDYVADIYQRLYHAENLTRPRGYVQQQPHLNAMMRAILIDWIVEVHMKFRLSPPTLYLCVNIIDRYLNLASVERENLQLVGVTALLIACKYEEIYPPEVRDCVYITDRAYTRQDVLDMEQEIVKRLEFKMTVPTGHPFLQRFLTITDATATVCMAANYYMERLLQEHDMLDYRPSLVAAAAVCLALNNPEIREFDDLEGPNPGIPELLLAHTRFSAASICEVAKKISMHVAREVTTQSGRDLIAVKRKYEANKFQQVAIRFSDPTVEDITSVYDDSE